MKSSFFRRYRDLIEIVIIAWVVGLLTTGFVFHAWAIPTGAMAPTLMGRHKELHCPQCGFLYSVNASGEVGRLLPLTVYSGICVNCRYQTMHLNEVPSFRGDRILAMMFPYDLPFLPGSSSPQRWDVVVFRYPEEPEVSYVSRLVGLPGETIRIKHGDIYIKQPGSDAFRPARKPLARQSAMQMPVYDDRFRPRALNDGDEWRRWQSETPGGWRVDSPKPNQYQAEEKAKDQWIELRYRHLVPDPEQWDAITSNRTLPRAPRPTLVTDFYAFNTDLTPDGSNLIEKPRDEAAGAWLQPHWVGDLSLSAIVDVISPQGKLRLELIKGGVPHRVIIDMENGSTHFTRGDQTLTERESPIRGPGRYKVEFANVDDRMTLMVNDRSIWDSGEEYDQDDEFPVPTAADLAPAAIAVRNGLVTVSDLVLKRDIYYTQFPGRPDYDPVWEDRRPRTPADLFDFLSDPAQLANQAKVHTRDYELGADRFMVMGDNSPRSKDSRAWDSSDLAWNSSNRQPWELPRNLLAGKVFYLYGPHSVPFGPNIPVGEENLLMRPYFERMGWIR